MPKNEEGEFELVLGNRQLLSIFFIVVILFGVFFTMGYIVGRNSAPTLAAEPGPARGTVAEVHEPASASEAAPAPAAAEPAPPSQTTPAAVDEQKQAPPPPKQTAAPPETVPAPAAATEPGPNRIFLQVAAVGRPEAEVEVGILKKRGFPAQVGPGPREGLFRVLVGPYSDSASAGRAKTDLENLGFKPIVRK